MEAAAAAGCSEVTHCSVVTAGSSFTAAVYLCGASTQRHGDNTAAEKTVKHVYTSQFPQVLVLQKM